jgi:hypothetical protein
MIYQQNFWRFSRVAENQKEADNPLEDLRRYKANLSEIARYCSEE